MYFPETIQYRHEVNTSHICFNHFQRSYSEYKPLTVLTLLLNLSIL